MASDMTELSVGFLGAGDVADLHADAIMSCPGARLHGVWNRTPGRGQRKAEQYDCRSYATAEELVKDPTLDAVFVLTNLETHREYAELAMQHGKHVLVEKPAGCNLEEIASMREVAKQHNVQCVPVHNYVYEPSVERTRDLIDRQKLGKLVSVHVLYNIHHQEAVAARYPGVIRQIMTHHAYILLYLAGAPKTVAAMKASVNDGSVEQENLAVATLQMQNGAIAHLHASFAADDHSGDPWTCLIKVIGTDGATRFSYRDWVENKRAHVHSHTYSAYPFSIERTVHHFLTKCVRNGLPPLSSMQDAYDAQRIIEGCEASIAEQRIIQL
ncbi:MAG: putative dehydrogenase [Planctomycetota bacterium]|jgi:predicted dehydrogenase